jgi:hypothetical protein
MTETERDPRPAGPYRRQPPTIDIGAKDYQSSDTGSSAPEAGEPVVVPTPDEPLPDDAHREPKADTTTELGTSFTSEPVAPAEDERATVTAEPTPSTAGIPPITGGGATNTDAADSLRAEPPARRGIGSLLAASLVGGLVGAGLAVGADHVLRDPGADTAARVATLEARTRAMPTGPTPVDLGPISSRIVALEATARDLSAQVAARPTDGASPSPAAQAGTDGLAARLAAVEESAKAAPGTAQLDELRTKLDETAADAQARTKANADNLAALQASVASLQDSIRSFPTAEAVTEIRARIQALATSSEDRAKANADAASALQSASASLEGRLKLVSDELGRLPPDLMLAGLRVVASGQVGNDLTAGRPLGPALAALGRFGTPAATLDALRPFADKPAPSAAALAAEFKPLAERMTAEPAGANATISERLMRIADKIVTVKAIGDGSGTDLAGLVGRIEAALSRGNLPDAAAAWDALPDTAKAISSDWASRLKARAAADEAARRIAADALAALGRPSP